MKFVFTEQPPKTYVLVCSHLCLLAILVTLFLCFLSPNATVSLKQFDANHYFEISSIGYNNVNAAFFPLFPFVITLLKNNTVLVSVFNSLVFLFSAAYLFKKEKFSSKAILLSLGLPSVFFLYVPYSESLFFLGSVLMITHLEQHRKGGLFYLGFFISCLSRPAFTVLIPAIFLLEFNSLKDIQLTAKEVIYPVLVAILGVAVVSFIQFDATKSIFGFFEAQKHWDNKLRIPTLPFTTWGGNFIQKTDSSALFIGTISAVLVVLKLFKNKINLSRATYFSLLYLSGITATVVAFRGGYLFSLNRFVFPTAFCFVAINYVVQKMNLKITNKMLVYGFLCSVLFFLACGNYVHLVVFLKYLLVAFLFALALALNHESLKIRNIAFVTLYFSTLIIQAYLFHVYLTGGWVA